MRSCFYAGSYMTTRTKKSKAGSVKPLKIYTDASVSRDGSAGTAAVALYSDENEPELLSRKHFPSQCLSNNNEAECCGAIIAVDSVLRREYKGVLAIVHTDNYRVAQVGRREVDPARPWEVELLRTVEAYEREHPRGLMFEWVRSHSGDVGNTHADKEARRVRMDPGEATKEPLPSNLIQKLTSDS